MNDRHPRRRSHPKRTWSAREKAAQEHQDRKRKLRLQSQAKNFGGREKALKAIQHGGFLSITPEGMMWTPLSVRHWRRP